MLDALSFRLMVIDHINKLDEEIEANIEERPSIYQNFVEQNNIDEKEIKTKIEKEVNKLIFQKQSENIVAFKELWEKE